MGCHWWCTHKYIYTFIDFSRQYITKSTMTESNFTNVHLMLFFTTYHYWLCIYHRIINGLFSLHNELKWLQSINNTGKLPLKHTWCDSNFPIYSTAYRRQRNGLPSQTTLWQIGTSLLNSVPLSWLVTCSSNGWMTGAFHEVLELSPEVSIVAELLHPLLCLEMTNTEMDLPIWKVLLGLPVQPVVVFDSLPHSFLLQLVAI